MAVRVAAIVLLLAASVVALAQPAAKPYRIGVISMLPPGPSPSIEAFRKGLKELGYVEGKNVILELRFAHGRAERFPELAAELLRLKVDVLQVGSTPGVLAVKKANTTVPIVFAGVSDPVGSGIVASLARPGGNATGTSVAVDSRASGKWLELLKEVSPGMSHVAVLANYRNPPDKQSVREVEAAARKLNVKLDIFDAADGLDAALARIGASGAMGLIVSTDSFLYLNRAKLAQFAASRRLPAVYWTKDYVDAGGLMAYGANLADSYRRAATYVDKILKGAKPAELPIDQPTVFELSINLKAAKALDIAFPKALLFRADHIVE